MRRRTKALTSAPRQVSAVISDRALAEQRAQAEPALLGNQEWMHALGLRAKLTVSQPGDEDEREADRAADAFASGAPRAGHISRKCASCSDDESVTRKAADAASTTGVHATARVLGNLTSSRGAALPDASRHTYERFFGADLSRVRVHTGGHAGAAAREFNARAFTRGYNIYFGAGEHAAHDATRGSRLLSHELAHVVQQGDGRADRIARDVAPAGGAAAADPAVKDASGAISKAVKDNDVTAAVTPLRPLSLPSRSTVRKDVQTQTQQWLERFFVTRMRRRDAIDTLVSAVSVLGGVVVGPAAGPLGSALGGAKPSEKAGSEEGLRLLWPVLPLIDRLEIYDEGYREIEKAQLDVIRVASQEERDVAAKEEPRIEVVYTHMAPKDEYEARVMMSPANRMKATKRLLEEGEKDGLLDAILKLQPAQRQSFYNDNRHALIKLFSADDIKLVHTLSFESEAQALIARLRLATEGRIDDKDAIKEVVDRAVALLQEEKQLRASLASKSLPQADKDRINARLAEMGDLRKLVEFDRTGGALAGKSFMGLLAEAAGSPDEFGTWALRLGADPFQIAKQRILLAAGTFSVDPDAVARAIMAVHAAPIPGADKMPAEERKKKQREADIQLRKDVLKDPEVKAIVQRLRGQGPAGAAYVANVEGAVNADEFDELHGQLGAAADGAQWGEVFRIALAFSKNPDWKRRFVAGSTDPWGIYVKVRGEPRGIMEEILNTQKIPLYRVLDYTGDVELLRTALSQLDEATRGKLRLGYVITREKRDESKLDKDGQEALTEFRKFEAAVRKSQTTIGVFDNAGFEAVLGASLGSEPTAEELSTPEGRWRAAALMYHQEQARLELGRGVVAHFTETDETMLAAARSFAALWEQFKDKNVLSSTDFAALVLLHDRFETRAEEFKETSETVSEIGGMVAATVAGVVIIAATGGTATPFVVAGAFAAGAGARVVAREILASDYYTAASEKGVRDAMLGGIDAALAVIGGGLAARSVELLGLSGRALTTAAAHIGQEVAGQAIAKVPQTFVKRALISGLEGAIDGAFSGFVSEGVGAFTDARTWRRGVWNGLAQVGQAALIGGLTGLATGGVLGTVLPIAGRGAKSLWETLAGRGIEDAIARAGATETLAAARQAALKGEYTEMQRLMGQLEKHLTPEQASALRRELFASGPALHRPPGTAEPKSPQQARLLKESAGADARTLTVEQFDAELDVVRRSQRKPSSEPGYVNEVDLGNGHAWRQKKDGSWCRFTKPEFCGTVIPDVDLPGSLVTDARFLGVDEPGLAALRTRTGAGSGDTIAVGRTDVRGVEDVGVPLEGASPILRTEEPVLHTTQQVASPQTHPRAVEHAEEGVLNRFEEAVARVRPRLREGEFEGKALTIYVSNPPCSACLQGLNNPLVDPGVLMQASLRYPGLTIRVNWRSPEGNLMTLIIQNGIRL